MTQVAEDKPAQASHYLRLSEASTNGGPSWVNDLRRSGIRRFDQIGFPSNRQEDFRHTNFQPIARTTFGLAEAVETDEPREFSFGKDAACELVFVNGHFSPQLSKLDRLPRGLTVRSLAEALETSAAQVKPVLAHHANYEANPFVALNTGFIHDGAFVHIAKNTTIDGPIHLLFFSTASGQPTVSHPRVLVIAEDNAEAQIVESYVGTSGTYFTNAVTEILLGNDCRIDHCKLQQESRAAFHVATMEVALGRATTFVSQAASIGAKLSRNDLNCHMFGEGAYATLNGVVLIKDDQHCDNHTLLDHAAPNCPSHELYKHVLDGRASGVFRGKILVRQPAQKTDSKQNSKSLLLSDDAYMNSQPALEIYADDVKCTHGSTTGPVDEDMVFYLRTRGVSLEAARHLLTYAFAADVTRRMRVQPVRQRIENFMAAQHGLPQDLRITDLGAFDDKAR